MITSCKVSHGSCTTVWSLVTTSKSAFLIVFTLQVHQLFITWIFVINIHLINQSKGLGTASIDCSHVKPTLVPVNCFTNCLTLLPILYMISLAVQSVLILNLEEYAKMWFVIIPLLSPHLNDDIGWPGLTSSFLEVSMIYCSSIFC